MPLFISELISKFGQTDRFLYDENVNKCNASRATIVD